MVCAVLYLHTVTTRNKTIGVHVMDLGSGKDQGTNEKNWYKTWITPDRGGDGVVYAECYHEAARGISSE